MNIYKQKDKEGSEQLIREHTKTLKEGHSGFFFQGMGVNCKNVFVEKDI